MWYSNQVTVGSVFVPDKDQYKKVLVGKYLVQKWLVEKDRHVMIKEAQKVVVVVVVVVVKGGVE